MSAQPHSRSRAPRRDRDVELDRLVAAELDACEAPLETLIEKPEANDSTWVEELSSAERDFVELVRQWLDRRPNKHRLASLICEGIAPSQIRDPFLPPGDSAASAPLQAARNETSSAAEDAQPDSSAEPDPHAAP